MLKIVDRVSKPIAIALNRKASLLKKEDLAYVGSFLTSLRSKLLPKHSQSLKHYPTKNEIDLIYKDIYKEINELYVDETIHLANNDYLEQTYNIISCLHKLARKYELVYDLKLEENIKKFKANDPNQFPVYDLTSNNLIRNFIPIWDLVPSIKQMFEEEIGFSLKVKKSNIVHDGIL